MTGMDRFCCDGQCDQGRRCPACDDQREDFGLVRCLLWLVPVMVAVYAAWFLAGKL